MAAPLIILFLAEETDFRPAGKWMCFAIPEFQALNNAVTGQGNGAAPVSFADDLADLQGFGLSVAIMDHNAVEFDGRIVYTHLKEAITPGGSSHFNVVVIMLAVNMRLAQINPVFGVRCWGHEC